MTRRRHRDNAHVQCVRACSVRTIGHAGLTSLETVSESAVGLVSGEEHHVAPDLDRSTCLDESLF